VYTGVFQLAYPAMMGHAQVWVDESATETDPRREAMVAYVIGGNPGDWPAIRGSWPAIRGSWPAIRGSWPAIRGSWPAIRGSWPSSRGSSAPLVSPGGQMILFTGNGTPIPEGDLYTIQSMASLPSLPAGRQVIGQGYSLVASPNVTQMITGSISFQYMSMDVLVEQADEERLTIYYWDENTWRALDTVRSPYYNMVSARSQGPGIYALMSSIDIALESPGWNLFSYPVRTTRPVSQALLSISGYYKTVYDYRPADTNDPWKMYDVTVPPWVNDLSVLEYGRVYWINVTRPITLYLSEGTSFASAAMNIPTAPPSTFYGEVVGGAGLTPTAGMKVTAWVNGNQCGQGQTRDLGNEIVYVVDVSADDLGSTTGCGAPGRWITFQVANQHMASGAAWDNTRVYELALSPRVRLYLPLVIKSRP
jgi:hypothetical protein